MISFEKINGKTYKMKFADGKDFHLQLLSRKSVTNQFDIVASCITEMSKFLGENFDEYVFELLSKYHRCKNDEEKVEFLSGESDFIAGYANNFVDKNGVDYSALVRDNKLTQTCSFPYEAEIKKIIKISVALKICSLLLNSPNGLSEDYYRKDTNQPEASFGAVNAKKQIIRVLKALNSVYENEKAPRKITTESGRLSLILPGKSKSYVHGFDLSEVARTIIGILPTLKHDSNPIPLFIGVIRNVIEGKWQSDHRQAGFEYVDKLEGKKHFSWDEQIGVAEKLSQLAQMLEPFLIGVVRNSFKRKSSIEKDLAISLFDKRLKEVKYVSPFWRFVTVPLIEKVFKICDNFEQEKLKGMYPKDAALLSCHIGREFRRLFPNNYSYLLEFASYFAMTKPPRDTKYSLRNIAHLVDTTLKLTRKRLMVLGFGSRIDFARVIEHFVGVMRRTKLCNILTGQEVQVDVPRLEKEAIDYFYFFHFFFTDVLNESKLDQLRDRIWWPNGLSRRRKEVAGGFQK